MRKAEIVASEIINNEQILQVSSRGTVDGTLYGASWVLSRLGQSEEVLDQ